MRRFGRALAVFFLIAGVGCGGNSNSNRSHLACNHSLEEICTLLHGCPPLTWEEVQSGQAPCLHVSAYLIADHYAVGNCGNYHELLYFVTGSGPAFYYDATTGQLVAIVTTGDVPPIQPSCAGGPPEGFTLPSCGTLDGGSVYLDCSPDAGGI